MGTKRQRPMVRECRAWIVGALFLVSPWMGSALMAQGSGAAGQDDAWRSAPPTSTGIAVGERIPAFRVQDQNGTARNFDSIKGPNGAAIYFMRSADW